MTGRKMKRGPAVAAAGTSLSAMEATVQSAYVRSCYQRKEIELVQGPRVWIADTIELLIDCLDYSDNPHTSLAKRIPLEDSL